MRLCKAMNVLYDVARAERKIRKHESAKLLLVLGAKRRRVPVALPQSPGFHF